MLVSLQILCLLLHFLQILRRQEPCASRGKSPNSVSSINWSRNRRNLQASFWPKWFSWTWRTCQRSTASWGSHTGMLRNKRSGNSNRSNSSTGCFVTAQPQALFKHWPLPGMVDGGAGHPSNSTGQEGQCVLQDRWPGALILYNTTSHPSSKHS